MPDRADLATLYNLLQRAQNAVVARGAEQLPLQKHVLGAMERTIAERGEGAVWTRAEVVAIIGYGLAGGAPRHVGRLLGHASLEGGLDDLVRGLVAFRQDRRDAAVRHLADVNDRAVPAVLRPAVAMIRGTLAMETSPQEAAQHFRLAARLAPGTLVEEAALRRSMALSKDDAAALLRLARQYWQRFPNSPYRKRVATLVQTALLESDPAHVALALDGLVPLLPPADHYAFLTALSRQALLAGRSDLVGLAVSRMRIGEKGGQKIAARNNALLEDVARLTGEDVEGVSKRLERLDPALLSRENRALLVVSRQVAKDILAPLYPPEHAAPPSEATAAYRARLSAIDALLDD